jgi:hypothetical protein
MPKTSTAMTKRLILLLIFGQVAIDIGVIAWMWMQTRSIEIVEQSLTSITNHLAL